MFACYAQWRDCAKRASEAEALDAAYRWAQTWEKWRRSFHWGV